MSRKAGTQQVIDANLNTGALATAGQALQMQSLEVQQLMAAYNVTHANPDALETEIRGYQQTAVEALFAIGARLMVLRALTLHGDWKPRLERIGMAPRAAQRVMQATLKFANPLKPRDKLLGIGKGKLLELLVLDDEQLDVLESGGTVLELDLDEVAAMSPTELRNKLREQQQEVEAKDKLLKKRGDEIDRLKNAKAFKPSADSVAQTEAEQAQYLALQEVHAEATAIAARLAVVVREIDGSTSQAMHQAAHAAMEHLCQRVADICSEHGMAIQFEEMVTPAWLQDAAPAKRAQGKK